MRTEEWLAGCLAASLSPCLGLASRLGCIFRCRSIVPPPPIFGEECMIAYDNIFCSVCWTLFADMSWYSVALVEVSVPSVY
jgi:hypothetical protein